MSNQVETDPQLVRRLNIFSAATSLFSIATGISGLLGWVLGSAILKSWLPGQTTMRVNAAVCLVLLGVAFRGLRKESTRAGWTVSRVASRIAAAGVSLMGFLSLLENLFGWDLRIDQLLHMVRAGEEVGGTAPGLIPLVPSVSLTLLGIALLALDWKARNQDWVSQVLAGAAGVVSSLGLLDYALGQGSSQTHIAFPSALNLVLFSMGVICSRPQAALGGLLVSRSAGAKLLRRAGPIALAVLIIFGKLTSKALLTDIHLAWIEVCAIAITAGLLLGVYILSAAILLDRSERQRLRAEQALPLSPEKLAQWMGRHEDSPVEGHARRWSMIGITVGILLAAIGGLSTWLSMKKAAEDANWVTHSHAVKEALEQTLAHAIDIESGSRGFAATGNDAFMEPFLTAKNSIPKDLDYLKSLTADDPLQQQRLLRLQPEIDARIEAAENTITMRKQTNTLLPVEVFAEGKRRMDVLRASIREMRAEENTLLDQRAKAAADSRREASVVILISTVLGIILLALAGIVTGREISRSVKLRGHIENLNLDLERRVRDRTEELRLSELRVRVLLDSTAEAIFGQDAEGNCIFSNRATEQLFGYQAHELLGKNIHSLIHHSRPDGSELPMEKCPIAKAAQSGKKCHSDQMVFWRKDGTSFASECWSHPLLVDGNVVGAVVSCLDISQRRLTEQALAEKVRLLDLSYDAIIVLNKEDLIAYWNQGAVEAYGYSSEEAVGRNSHELLHTAFPQPLSAIFETLQRDGRWTGELVQTRKGGSRIIVSSRWAADRDAKGNILAILETNSDITERKQAEEALRRSEALLETAVENLTEAVIVSDPQGNVLHWNGPGAALFGYDDPEQGRIPLAQFPETFQLAELDGTILPLNEWPLSRILRGESLRDWEIHLRRRNTDWHRIFSHSGTLVRDGNGRPLLAVLSVNDVTDRKRAEQEIRRLNSELEQRVQQRTAQLEAANKELEAFTYSVSHDLRAPLRHISGFSKILLDECTNSISADAQHYLQRIEEGTRRMGLLVDALLNLARVGRRDLSLQVTGLKSVVEEVIDSLAPDLVGRKVEWKVGELPIADCDAGLIKQVFQNLISNAIKFTRHRPQAIIEIGQMQQNGSPVIFVRDNGAGFSMKYADKLFGVFQRLHPSEDFEGTGVGLATVQRIVQKHGGRVWAEAELDNGATFYFTLGKCDVRMPNADAVAAGEQA